MLKIASVALALTLTTSVAFAQDRKPQPHPTPVPAPAAKPPIFITITDETSKDTEFLTYTCLLGATDPPCGTQPLAEKWCKRIGYSNAKALQSRIGKDGKTVSVASALCY